MKYVTRYKGKNGIEDLKKAIHYLQIAEETCHSPSWSTGAISVCVAVTEYCEDNGMEQWQYDCISHMLVGRYKAAAKIIEEFIK